MATDFIFLSRLGKGSFGTVFKCRRKQDDLLYALKVVRIADLTLKEKSEAVNEVRLLAALDSAFIVRYYDSFISEEGLHIITEYCNRGDLCALLLKAKEKSMQSLKEDLTWNIALQIILGLYDLHAQNILHRDLKTANVFLQKEASARFFAVKIGDLGVAKLLDTSAAFAQTIVGTPYYLSPELCADQPYGDRSDCWALGVILYECCTLTRPFEARNQCALIMKIIQAQVEAPPATHASEELTALILWLLQKDWTQRPRIQDLLCEAFIQEKLEEHGLSLPEALLRQPLTHRLSLGVGGSSSSGRSGSGSSPTAASPEHNAADDEDDNAANNNNNDNSSSSCDRPRQDGARRASTESGRRPTLQFVPARGLVALTLSAPLPVAAIRGDRVRGPAHAKRQTSSKVLTRYQVKSNGPAPLHVAPHWSQAKDTGSPLSASEKEDNDALSALSLALSMQQEKMGPDDDGADGTTFRVGDGAKHATSPETLLSPSRDQRDGDSLDEDEDEDAEYLRNFKLDRGLATPSAAEAKEPRDEYSPYDCAEFADGTDPAEEEYEEDFEEYDADDDAPRLYETCREQPGGAVPALEAAVLLVPSWAIRDSPLSARGPAFSPRPGGEEKEREREGVAGGQGQGQGQAQGSEADAPPGSARPDSDEAPEGKPLRLQEQERIFTLQSWISDIRTRLHDDIGGALFNSLYAIVHSNAANNTTFLTGLAETDEYIRDIHSRLNDQLQTTLEGASRIVLRIKTLIALESEVGVRVPLSLSLSIPPRK